MNTQNQREKMETMSDVANRVLKLFRYDNPLWNRDRFNPDAPATGYAYEGAKKIDVMMDLEYVNEVIPLDFDRLLAFDDGNFIHDMAGIYQHFDRATKTMGDCFCPRSAI